MKTYLFFVLFFLLQLHHNLAAQDTLSTDKNKDTTTAFERIQQKYNRLYYKYYGKYTQKKKKTYDTTYIDKHDEYIAVSSDLTFPNITFYISPSEFVNRTTYAPKLSSVAGFRIAYKNVAGSYHFKAGNMSNDDRLQNTEYSSFNFKIQNNKFNHMIGFDYLKGLTDITTDQNNGYIKRPDILLADISYELVCNLTWRKYSYIAPRTYTQHQLKSKVGFLLKGGLSANVQQGDSAIINPPQQIYYQSFTDINSVAGVTIKFAPGVGGNLVFAKRMYLSLVAFFGSSYYRYNYKREPNDNRYKSSSFAYILEGEASIGYQTERFFTGLHYEWKNVNSSVNDANLYWYNGFLGIQLGYRFKAPTLFKKAYNIIFPY